MGPFEEHLRDAVEINKKREKLYADLTHGKSKLVSRSLILSEKASIPFSKIPDHWAKKFMSNGIPIVKEEFISMNLIPSFSKCFPFEPEPRSEYKRQNGTQILSRIFTTFRKEGFEGAKKVLMEELNHLQSPRAYHVMLRHILESMLRVATLAPAHEALRLKLGFVDSTLPLSHYLFYSHFSSFHFAVWLDEKAAPLQASGIPILFQDVPNIPAESEFYKDLKI